MKRSVKLTLASVALALGIPTLAGAQETMADGFTKLPTGLEYKILTHGNGTHKPAIGDHIEMYIHVHIGDSVLFDSRKMYKADAPVPFPISAPKFKSDPMEGFMLLVAGDSAVLRVSVDSMKKGGNQMLPWMKEGQKIEYNVVLVTVRSDEEEKKFNEERAAKQKGVDEIILKDYFAKHKIKPLKTPSGLYYTISKKGTGENAKAGQSITVNYTGKLLDGKPFDSNVDSAFHHTEPFTLEIGKGKVIKGWDEGFLLFNKGTKATLYIPSTLAYGPQEQRNIPGNSILVFDVELKNIANPGEADKDAAAKAKKDKAAEAGKLQAYFTKNKLKPLKTASGLYYTISAPGAGDNIKAGQQVSVNYTGRSLDGKPFDSNTDTAFHHTQPFNVEVGKGRVIKGWDEGLQLLKKGSKARFYIPSDLAYGERGNQRIAPNATLIFDVEVLDVQNAMDQGAADEKLLQNYFAQNHIQPKKTASGVYYVVNENGSGEKAQPGKKVSVNYTGKTMDGKAFDSNTDPKFGHVSPFSFGLGQGQVIRGWDEGIQQFRNGGKGTLYIPSALGYGPNGMGSAIPPNAILIFDIELTGIDNQ